LNEVGSITLFDKGQIDMDQQQEEGTDRQHPGGGLVIALFAVSILYLVLLGPAVRLYDSCPQPIQTAIVCIYGPLAMLDGSILGNLIDKYVEMWE
jgi:hypothetical protein